MSMELLFKICHYAIIPNCFFFMAFLTFLSYKAFGWKATWKTIIAGILSAYILEEIGVHTGIIFGRYWFEYPMGPKLDVVPIAVGLGWTGLLMIAWYVSNLLIDGTPGPKSHSHTRIWFGAIMTGLLAGTLDVTLDPLASGAGFWTWLDGGRFFNVPYHNWVGWFIVGFIGMLIHGYLMRDNADSIPEQNELSKFSKLLLAVPIAFYAIFGLVFVFVNYDDILGLVSVYCCVIPALIGLWKYVKWYKDTKELTI